MPAAPLIIVLGTDGLRTDRLLWEHAAAPGTLESFASLSRPSWRTFIGLQAEMLE